MAKVKLLRGTTHRFRCQFKDVATENPIAMVATGVKVQFWLDGTMEDEYTANKEATGNYYYDYYIPEAAALSEWKCRFEGTTQAGSIQKGAAKKFYIIDAPED